MNYFLFLSVLFASAFTVCNEQLIIDIEVKSHQEAAMRMFVGLVGAKTSALDTVAQTIKKDLEFEGQFAVECHHIDTLPTVSGMHDLAASGYLIAVFLQEGSKKKKSWVDWYVYDTHQACMLAGKRHMKVGSCQRGWGHELAESLIELLTGRLTSFASRIAYCKDVQVPGRRAVRHIYVADMVDFQHSNEQVTARPTLNIAPRWNRDLWHPLLFYSEGTDRNFRLMSTDLHGHIRVASNMDGINMQPTFSSDGKRAVFCASRGAGSSQLYSFDKQQGLKRLTYYDGNTLAPTMTADGSRVYFCSDHENKVPAIYCYSMNDGTLVRITHGGMAFSPHYCDARGQVTYVQSVRGVLQIFAYDEATKIHRQLTFDGTNKEECSWSPCGSYIVYCSSCQGKGRITLLHVATGKVRYLTHQEEDCSYPIWSPRYASYPAV